MFSQAYNCFGTRLDCSSGGGRFSFGQWKENYLLKREGGGLLVSERRDGRKGVRRRGRFLWFTQTNRTIMAPWRHRVGGHPENQRRQRGRCSTAAVLQLPLQYLPQGPGSQPQFSPVPRSTVFLWPPSLLFYCPLTDTVGGGNTCSYWCCWTPLKGNPYITWSRQCAACLPSLSCVT